MVDQEVDAIANYFCAQTTFPRAWQTKIRTIDWCNQSLEFPGNPQFSNCTTVYTFVEIFLDETLFSSFHFLSNFYTSDNIRQGYRIQILVKKLQHSIAQELLYMYCESFCLALRGNSTEMLKVHT